MQSQDRTLSTVKLCKSLGVKRISVSRWVKAGCPHSKAPGLRGALSFNEEEVVQWLAAMGKGPGASTRSPAEPVGEFDDPPPADTSNLSAVDIAGLIKRAELKIKKLEARKRERVEQVAAGELLDAAEIRQGRLQRIAIVRQGLLGMPSKLAQRLVGKQEKAIQRVIEVEVDDLLREFSKGFEGL